MGKYFGTDGFRGVAGVVLTSEHAYKIGRFLGGSSREKSKKVRVVIGKDTRRSGYMLEYALASGVVSSGGNAYMLHVTTTPSVSYVASLESFDYGVMISASHNPYGDNGIKIVNSRGEKIDDEFIADIEAYMDGTASKIPFAAGEEVGEIVDYCAGRDRYIEFLVSLSKYSFKNYKIALDAANGGAWMIAKSVFEALGAETYVIGADPNGVNINVDVGSTHINAISELVKRRNLDLGFAFDGDADRCIAVDHNGEEVNGDHILYILASLFRKNGELAEDTVVTTVMSNLGLYRALDEAGIKYEQTSVGDRFVYENMQKNGYSLGGEQSGHIIIAKYAATGDGIMTAIKLMEAVIESKKTLAELAEPIKMLPQITESIHVTDKSAVGRNVHVSDAIRNITAELDGRGRILLRESGTEPVVRVMVEAEDEKACRAYCDLVLEVIRAEGLAK